MIGRKRKLSKKDKTTRQLQAGGVYTLGHAPHPYVVEQNTVEAVKEKEVYNFWSGVWYVTILSILLFWIPPFGQMIAGYVGGRKAGTPKKGFAAALVPMSIIFLLFILVHLGIMVDQIGWIFGLPEAGATYLASNLPIIGPLVNFMTEYVQTFVETMGFGGNFVAPYVLTVVLGYTGGILSLHHQREMEAEGIQPPAPVVVAAPQPQPVVQQQQVQSQVIMGKKPDGWDEKKKKR
jgi:hypothetical protein